MGLDINIISSFSGEPNFFLSLHPARLPAECSCMSSLSSIPRNKELSSWVQLPPGAREIINCFLKLLRFRVVYYRAIEMKIITKLRTSKSIQILIAIHKWDMNKLFIQKVIYGRINMKICLNLWLNRLKMKTMKYEFLPIKFTIFNTLQTLSAYKYEATQWNNIQYLQ